MKTFLRFCIPALLFSFFAVQSIGQSIWMNPVTDPPDPSTFNPYITGQTVNANIIVSGIGRGAGITASSAANRYNATGWNSPALQWDDYFTFTLTPNAGFKINLVSFVYSGQVSAGPTGFAFKSSADGYNASIGSPNSTGTTISLAAASYQNLTSAITFRIYAFGASAGTGTFSINDFTFNGAVVAIAPSLTADLVDNPTTTTIGGTVNYKTTITNSGTGPATGVFITNTAPGNTSYTAGTHKTSALARDDNFATAFNTALTTGNVITNDFGFNDVGLPNVTVVSFGTTASNGITTPAGSTGTTDNSGTLKVNTNGTFTYTPLAGFSGLDKFAYVATTGAAGLANDKGIVTILVAPDITFTHVDVSPVCNNQNNGSITFNASGGNGNLTYSITGTGGTFQPSNTFTGLGGGIFNLVVKDAAGFTKTGTATLTNPSIVSYGVSTVNPSCNNVSDGSITFTNPQGGTGQIMFSIHGNAGPYQTSPVFSNLPQGSYTVTAKDANGCGNGGPTYTFTNPTAISVGGTIPNLTYNTAMSPATFTKSGGTGTLTFSMTGTPPTGLTFSAAAGTITGTPTQTGNFNITIIATDANNCTGSLPVAFSVAPKLANDAYNVVGNTQLVANGHSTPSTPFTTSSTNILANDLPASPIAVTPVTNAATTAGGSITIDATGKFTYTPPNGSTAADSYTYTATSNLVSATATINFTIANMIWFVNNTYLGANGAANGSSHRPYTTVNAAEAVSATSQTIYVHTGTGSTNGDAVLKASQTLRGAGSALSVGALSIAASTKPTLSGTITLANSVTVDGFDMSTLSNTAITSTGATLVNVSVGNITTSGAVNAITLSTTTGSVTIAGGTITGGAGAPFNIVGGTVSLTYSGFASQANAQPLVSVSGGHSTGTITFNTGTLNATNGTGLQFDNADGTYNFNGTTTLNGGDAGIDITAGSDATAGSTGTFTFGTATSITRTSVTGIAFNLAGSDANVTYSGNITLDGTGIGNIVDINDHDAGTITFQTGNLTKAGSTSVGISIQNSGGGTINFNNPKIAITTSGSTNAISLTGSNGGGTINFTPAAGGTGIDLVTTSGNGFNATGGGTVSITGTGNTITSGTGIALNVVNTTIGAGNLNFQSISANGGANGIMLNNTGSIGGLTVTGTGAANSGGTIQNMTGADDAGNTPVGTSIVLYKTSNTSLSWMKINDNSNYGINGISVAGLTISHCIVTGVNGTNQATPFSDGSITLLELSGTCSINNTEVTGGYQRNIRIDNTLGTLNLTVTACNIHNTSSAQGDDGLAIEIGSSGGASNATLHVTNNTFSAHGGDHFDLTVLESPTVSCVFTGNQGNPGNPVHALGLGQGFRAGGGAFNGTFSYDFSNNTIYGTKQGNAITINKGSGTGLFQGRISGNTIGQSGVTLSGASQSDGINVESRGGGTHTTLVTGNTIRQYREYGINIEGAEAGTTTFNVTCNSNTIDEPGSPGAAGLSLHGIQANWGIDPGNTSTLLLDLGGAGALKNIVTNSGNEPAGGFDIRLRQRQSTIIKLLGYGGANNDNAAVNGYITGRNTLTTVSATNTVSPGGGFQNTATVPQPVVPL